MGGFQSTVTLRLKVENYTTPDQFDVIINGVQLDRETRTVRVAFIMGNDTWFEYPLVDVPLNRGNNAATINVEGLNPQMSVCPVLRHVELVVKYRR